MNTQKVLEVLTTAHAGIISNFKLKLYCPYKDLSDLISKLLVCLYS